MTVDRRRKRGSLSKFLCGGALGLSWATGNLQAQPMPEVPITPMPTPAVKPVRVVVLDEDPPPDPVGSTQLTDPLAHEFAQRDEHFEQPCWDCQINGGE